MPFWKQSEDPWDRKPDKPPREPKEPQANPLDSLKAWNEERKAKAKEKEEARRFPPEPCPWCGKDMEQGFLLGGRDGVRWYPGIYKTDPLRGLDSTGRLCRDCKRAVFHMPDPSEYEDSFSARIAEHTENTQEEETSEG